MSANIINTHGNMSAPVASNSSSHISKALPRIQSSMQSASKRKEKKPKNERSEDEKSNVSTQSNNKEIDIVEARLKQLEEEVSTLEKNIEKLNVFFNNIKEQTEFDDDDKEKVLATIKERYAEYNAKKEEHLNLNEIYTKTIASFKAMLESRYSKLSSEDDKSMVLQENPELMKYFVRKQSELELMFKKNKEQAILMCAKKHK